MRPPSDKSLTHRAYIIAAISSNGGVIEMPLESHDCNHTLACVSALGARVSATPGLVRIGGGGTLMSPRSPLECGNSGTTMRLLAGLLSGAGVRAELRGDNSLSRRPMRRIVDPLRQMGAEIDGETAPLFIVPSELRGIDYTSPIASAQVKSALLLAGLDAEGSTSVTEPAASRDHTERMLAAAGCPVKREGLKATVARSKPLRVAMRVPADISSAAYFMVAAAILGGPITALQVGVNPTRTGILDVLGAVGANVESTPPSNEQGEPVADIIVAKNELRPFEISGAMVPRLIDEIPILAVLATQCEGTSTIRDAAELRVKESDRIATIVDGLNSMGANVEAFEDGLAVHGPTPLRGAKIDARRDHRIGMAFAIAGLFADGKTTIAGSETIDTSFPDFEAELRRLSDI
ncbi:MAG: 3-phosphoshikimate 1-carboxyvinyltransferase [Fimbriimonadales bacterium]